MILTNNDGLMLLKYFQALCAVLETKDGYQSLDLLKIKWCSEGYYLIPGKDDKGKSMEAIVMLWELEDALNNPVVGVI